MASIVSAGTTSSTALNMSADTSGVLQLASNNGTTAVTIDTSQYVGIGTTTPTNYSSASARAVIANNSSGANTVGLALVNNNSATSTAISLDFVPNTNIALAQIQALRTDVGGGGATNLRFLNYNGSAIAEAGKFSANGDFYMNTGYGSSALAFGCRAWCQFNGSQAIVAAGNFTSVTSNGTGDIYLNFSTSMPDANYSCVASTNEDGGTPKWINVTQPATNRIRIVTWNTSSTKVNNTYNFVAVYR